MSASLQPQPVISMAAFPRARDKVSFVNLFCLQISIVPQIPAFHLAACENDQSFLKRKKRKEIVSKNVFQNTNIHTQDTINTCEVMQAVYYLSGLLSGECCCQFFHKLGNLISEVLRSSFQVHEVHGWSLQIDVHNLLCVSSFNKGFKLVVLLSNTWDFHVDLIKNI